MKGPLNYWSAFGVPQTVSDRIKGHQTPPPPSGLTAAQRLRVLRCMSGGRWCTDVPQCLAMMMMTGVSLPCPPGLRVHREAGGDAGEAPDLWPRGSSAREVPLRLCTESVRRQLSHNTTTQQHNPVTHTDTTRHGHWVSHIYQEVFIWVNYI